MKWRSGGLVQKAAGNQAFFLGGMVLPTHPIVNPR